MQSSKIQYENDFDFSLNKLLLKKKAIGNFYLLEPKAGSDTECQACKDAAAMVVPLVERHAELDEIHEAMKEFCPVVSITDPEICKDRVEHWAPKMIKLIEDDHASPQMICQGLKICQVKG